MAKHTTKPLNTMIKGLVFQGKQAVRDNLFQKISSIFKNEISPFLA